LILLGSLFFSQWDAFVVAFCVMLGVFGAMAVSGILSRTVLHHQDSTFLMEMPPFRRPRFGQILIRSLLDRTLRIAGRALLVASPAGMILWILSNTSLLQRAASFLDPFAQMLGLNGIILFAFVCAFPANELLIPVILMALQGAGNLSAAQDTSLLLRAGWTWQTALCTMVFTVFHWPCSTTLLTVYHETKSAAKTAAAFFLPTAVGCLLCLGLNLLFQNLCG
jgi:ferrous iron transport protein B